MTDFSKPKETKKIILGKNRTRVTLHPIKNTLRKGPNETIIDQVSRIVLETKADHVGRAAYSKRDYDLAYSAPYTVLNDPNGPASLKDLAYRVVVVRNEDFDENEDEIMEEFLSEASNRGNNYRAAGASAAEVAQHKSDVDAGKKWVADRPASHHNIIAHYNAATPNEKAFGHSWYGDAHELTKHVANDTKTPMHTAAGLVGNYSPQNDWATNIHTAARVMRTKTAVGGKGSGVFASTAQKHAGERMLGGEHYDNVLKGHKIRAFTHLIEHGGNAEPEKPHVVIDRHAAAVAHGDRITDNAYKHGLGGMKSKNLYNSYEQHYHKAAKAINASNPGAEPVHAHQVQAVTWLVRQRKNQEMESGVSKTGSSKTAKRTEKSAKAWDAYRQEYHPKTGDIRKMSGYT